jgi:hypothetical protein
MSPLHVSTQWEVAPMVVVLLVLLLIALLAGAGFALHVLWWIAIAALVLWAVGWLFGAAEGGRRQWYGRW